MRIREALSILLLGARLLGAQSTAAGPECADCHRTQASTQSATQMARAMQLPGANRTLQAHPRLSFHHGAYTYTVETRDGRTAYTVSDGSRTISTPVTWAMGAEAQTWVVEHDGQMYESMVSYYPSIEGLDFTVGDDRIAPRTLEEAIGRPLPAEGVTSCFGCHATNAVVDHRLDLKNLTPGVACEHCHVGAIQHGDAEITGGKAATPPALGSLSSEQISNLCGQCHRTWELVVRAGWRGPANVRFQPYRLANSRCFDGRDPRIGCVACHDPHQAVVRGAASYDTRCLACHSSQASAAPPHAKTCPVAKAGCTSCHMPKVPFPGGHFTFTDHDIRVVKADQPYPY